MGRFTTTCATALLGFAVFSSAWTPAGMAEETPVSPEAAAKIRGLIEQLGDPEFARREDASNQLTEIGLATMDELRKVTRHTDPEVKYRAIRILAMVVELDFKRRLDDFIAGRSEAADVGLPGWKEFNKQFGDDPESRALFVELQKSESDALAVIDQGPAAIAEKLAIRSQELQTSIGQFRHQLAYGNVAAMIFMASIEDVPLTPQVSSILYGFCYQPNFRNELMSGERKEVSRKLMGAWIRRGEGWTLYQALNLAMQYDIQDGLIPAERALRDGPNQPHILQYAILAIARFGDESNIPSVEKVLERPEARNRIGAQRINNVNYEAQLYDVALAAMVYLAGEDPKEFGFERYQPNPQNVFNPGTVGFKSEEDRQTAHKKWIAFRAKQAENDEPPGPEHHDADANEEPPSP
ncbi:hypothetical protein [Lignipirellula cremea]|uniref:HEAT repeat protein n=1 Tax=Lignipirellula cremea TaxID=2528010 RepID=A0A518DRZ8_9BACT|nr:hypothetical protein [Lignipirellula cremea]QDU94603.1 hypothetical protein Pla8534_23960 [Lignipirellula cremea]